MSNTRHTPGPWQAIVWAQDEKTRAQMKANGIEPMRMLHNDGGMSIIGKAGEDNRRVAVVDCKAPYKRGQGYLTECAERDANAFLIAAAPAMFEALSDLIFTASKLWDSAKPIKDTQAVKVTHPMIENAKAALAQAKGE